MNNELLEMNQVTNQQFKKFKPLTKQSMVFTTVGKHAFGNTVEKNQSMFVTILFPHFPTLFSSRPNTNFAY